MRVRATRTRGVRAPRGIAGIPGCRHPYAAQPSAQPTQPFTRFASHCAGRPRARVHAKRPRRDGDRGGGALVTPEAGPESALLTAVSNPNCRWLPATSVRGLITQPRALLPSSLCREGACCTSRTPLAPTTVAGGTAKTYVKKNAARRIPMQPRSHAGGSSSRGRTGLFRRCFGFELPAYHPRRSSPHTSSSSASPASPALHGPVPGETHAR